MKKSFFTPFSHQELMPKEEKLEIQTRKRNFSIGIPKETDPQEKRISLTPDAVSALVANGHNIFLETGAGTGANYTDQEYSEAGARIVYEQKEVYKNPIILKIQPLTEEEIGWVELDAFIISSVLPNTRNKIYFNKLISKKITALGFEYIQDEDNNLPVNRILSEIAGRGSMLIASELMCTSKNGNGLLMGSIAGVRPTEVVIIGAGTVGEFASRSALGLGATVRVFDNSLTRLRELQNCVGYQISTSTLDPKELKKALMRCDVAIGAIRGKIRTPTVVSEEMVESMKLGAIVMDISIVNGRCFETSEITSHKNPTIIKHGVIHYGVANITSRFSRTSSKALSNFFLTYLLSVGEEGGFNSLLRKDKGLREGIYLYKGRVTKSQISNWFNLPFHDINLLII
jgi:alanine dehydrogenase